MLDAVFGDRHRYYQPRELIDIALAHKADFEPGSSVAYSNTNYVLAGLLIEKVTGRPLAEQINQRIIKPSDCATPTSPRSARRASARPTPRPTTRRSPGPRWRTSQSWTPPGAGRRDS